MKKPKFSAKQIAAILDEHKKGASATSLCRKYSISDTTFYKWRVDARIGRKTNTTIISELKKENATLKAQIENQMLRIVELEQQNAIIA